VVTVRDGHTIVLGGLITKRIEDRESKVPFLGDIPLLGVLFRSTSSVNTHKELLIILTPRFLHYVEGDADRFTREAIQRMQEIWQVEGAADIEPIVDVETLKTRENSTSDEKAEKKSEDEPEKRSDEKPDEKQKLDDVPFETLEEQLKDIMNGTRNRDH
jgi:Flp pilus assembly secretin CpaC